MGARPGITACCEDEAMADPPLGADPLFDPRPEVSPELAAALLHDVYGIAGELTALHGERDLNFRVDATDGRRYLLKVHHPFDSGDVVEMRTRAMAHVRRVDPSLPVPVVVATPAGADRAAIAGADGRVSDVQVFSFLEGVRHAASLRDRLDLLDHETGAVVEAAIGRFDAHVAPRLCALRAQVVHNDMNPHNVLVDGTGRIVGVTDFGDTTHTALVCDLAVALEEVLAGRTDGLAMAEPMIAGYCDLTPLEDAEAEVLLDLVAARAATDVVVTTWRRLHHPHAWELPDASLRLLRRIGAEGPAELAAHLAAVARRESGAAPAMSYSTRPTGELLAARRRVLGPLELHYDEPLHLVRGRGAHVFDADGRRYLDAYNNVPVAG